MTTILIKRSGISGSIPISGSLQVGELALNTTDGGLFYHDTGSDSVELIRAGTASFALNAASGGAGGPSSSWSETSSYTETWDGGVFETGSSFVSVQPSPLTASYALTSSVAISASFAPGGSGVSASFATTASFAQTASLLLGSVESASFAITASFASNAGGVTRVAPAQSDMLVWLKVDTGVNLDTTVSPALVDTWEDQSGNGNDASASFGSSARPQFTSESGAFNDSEFIRFTGTDVLTVDAGSTLVAGTSCSVWLVARRNAANDANDGILSFNDTGSADWTSNLYFVMEVGASGDTLTTFWNSSPNTTTDDNLTSGSFIWNSEFDGEFSRGRKDGLVYQETAKTTAFDFAYVYLCARELGSGPSNLAALDLVEVVLYRRNLTDDETTDMEAYLSAKYAIPIRGVVGK